MIVKMKIMTDILWTIHNQFSLTTKTPTLKTMMKNKGVSR